MSRRVAIVGSRYQDHPNPVLFRVQRKVSAFVNNLPSDAVVISGGAVGVDSWAENFARQRGLEVVVHRADWKTYGRKAGMLRNATIVEDADEVYAFWDGTSKGTANTIERARIAGKLKGVEVT
jgi:predicted Rossmann fold nucleotide-binding protein DprA/Smf involved in DNA uptake